MHIPSLIRTMLNDAYNGLGLPQFPSEEYMFGTPGYKYGDIATGRQIWEDREDWRVVMDDKSLQLVPIILFCDGTSVSSFGRSMTPIYAMCGLHDIAKRNEHIYLVGFLPEGAYKPHLLPHTINSSGKMANLKR